MAQHKEKVLIERSISGNKEAFGELIQRYQPLVCSMTYSATGDFDKSEELAQETFIKCWNGIAKLKDIGLFRGWLCTIARNVIRDFIRHKKKDIPGLAVGLDNAQDIHSTQDGPAESVISREQQGLIWNSLSNIPEHYRLPLILFYRQEQSVKQVAAELELSEATVKQRLSRGRKMLKEHVAALVSETLKRSKPGKKFTVAVLGALPVLTGRSVAAATGAATKGAVAKSAVGAGWLTGAVFGPVVGFLGGIFGTWMSIRNTSSQTERRFMVKASLCIWLEVLGLLGVLAVCAVLLNRNVISQQVFWWIFGVMMTGHVLLLVPAVLWLNRKQRDIQKKEGTFINHKEEERAFVPTTRAICANLGGSVFGGLAWLFVVSFMAGDYLSFVLALAAGVLVFLAGTVICARRKKKYWTIASWAVVAVASINLIFVNLRWGDWKDYIGESGLQWERFPLWAINITIGASGIFLIALFVTISRRNFKGT